MGSGRRGAAQQLVDEERGLGVDQGFRERRRLNQEEPVPVGGGKGHAGGLVHRQRRRDIEQHRAADRLGVVDAEPMRHARARSWAHSAKRENQAGA
jgi:hypothetical protein